jgi:hypothetical protein
MKTHIMFIMLVIRYSTYMFLVPQHIAEIYVKQNNNFMVIKLGVGQICLIFYTLMFIKMCY